MERVMLLISFSAGLFKLQATSWSSRIRYEVRFFLCGIFSYFSFAILKPLGDLLGGKENELIAFVFDNPPYIFMVLLSVTLGYAGLYTSIIAAALFASLLPKT